jgi:hypothetical protein
MDLKCCPFFGTFQHSLSVSFVFGGADGGTHYEL